MRHAYPARDLTGDFVRGGAGAVLTLGPVLLLDTHWVVSAILAAVGLLFAVFLLRTWQRRATMIETGPEGIAAHGPRGASIAWRDLDRLDLRYFSTRRDRTDGWLQLTLGGGGSTLKLESSLEGFDHVLERSADAARANGVLISETTQQNLQTMGIGGALDDEAAEQGPWTGNWARPGGGGQGAGQGGGQGGEPGGGPGSDQRGDQRGDSGDDQGARQAGERRHEDDRAARRGGEAGR